MYTCARNSIEFGYRVSCYFNDNSIFLNGFSSGAQHCLPWSLWFITECNVAVHRLDAFYLLEVFSEFCVLRALK
jgi:hypothetical protein